MAFIRLITPEEAAAAGNNELTRLYSALSDGSGQVLEYFLAQGALPGAITAQCDLLGAVMRDGALPRPLKEQIGLVVSGINSSSYCIAVHMEILHGLGVEKPIGRKLVTDYENAPVGEPEKVLFRFADKLTRRPFDVTQEDAAKVLGAGWSEQALLETVLTVAWFGFTNRVTTGLGLVAEY